MKKRYLFIYTEMGGSDKVQVFAGAQDAWDEPIKPMLVPDF
jgi:hypothetical protein